MTASPRKAYARLSLASGEIDLHYRVLGRGPALLMLHPSPLSSAFMVPMMQRFSASALTIAPDTPGYGRSSSMPGTVSDLAPYVEAMRRFVDVLGLTQYAIYGSATGAQIAVELAKQDASRVTGVILDNAADFTDEECEGILQGYFPDATPSEDGSHLARIWQVAHDSTVFFPWHHPCEENRIAPQPGAAELMHMTAMSYLQAGPDYAEAYRAAFRNERAERVRGISAPVSIIRWPSSILKRYTDRFDGYQWGSQVHMAHCEASMEARLQCIEAQFPRVLGSAPAAAPSTGEQAGFGYVSTSFGQVRYGTRGEHRNTLRVHAFGESIESIDADGVLIDLPGHGESDCPPLDSVTQYIDACAESARRVTEVFTLPTQAIDREVASIGQDLDDIKAPPSLRPETSGAHLWRGWYHLRSQRLQRATTMTSAAVLTQKLLDLFASQTVCQQLRDLSEGAP